MVGVSCETDNVYREATYILTPIAEAWVDKKSASKSKKTPTSYHGSASVHPNPDDFLTPVGSRKSAGVSMKKCRFCGKEFRTTGALDTHLLIHRPKKSQRVFKQNQSMSHMSTHQNKKTYHCTYSGCHKTYDNQNSLKDHCALRHGVRIISPSSDRPTSRWEPVDTSSVSKQQSYNTDLCGFLNSPRKPLSFHVPKDSSSAQDTDPSQVKRSKKHLSWTLATASKSYDVKEREMLTSTRRTPSVPHTPEENPGVISINDSDFESGPDSPELLPRRMPSLQHSKVTATSTVDSSIQLKQSLKSLNKLKRKRPSFNHALSCPKSKNGLIGDFPDPAIAPRPSAPVIRTPSPVPLPENRKREYNSKVLTDDRPVPQISHECLQTQSPCLFSPSLESPMRATGQEHNSKRTYTRRPAVCKTQTQSPRGSYEKTEELAPKPCYSTLRDEEQKQKSERRKSATVIIPVTVPATQTKAVTCKSSPHPGEQSQTHKGLSKRSLHLTPPIISSPSPSPKRTHDLEGRVPHGCCATRGRPSNLHSPDQCASPVFHPPPYTPPAMLSPHRPRTGLYFNAQPAPASNNSDVDDTVIAIKPRINIGSHFQAEIPSLRNTFYMLYEEHPAQLVWSPWKDLTTNRKTQKKVTELLDMCCSSVLTGGGTNIELALHCLHEVQGNIQAALDLLLMREDFRIAGHPLNNYHYTGSDHWTDQEMRLFRKALEDHGKDFNEIHNVLQTKSVAQCVEYYYLMKNLKKFKQRVKAADEKDVEETSVFQDSKKTPPEQKKPKTRKRNTRRTGVQKRCPHEEPMLHLNQDRDWLPPDNNDSMSQDLYGP